MKQVEILTTGSSPRVRGTPSRMVKAIAIGRFIPACAGNAGFHVSRPGLVAVHPRVCGERGFYRCNQCKEDGSSPRVRGTRRNRGGVEHRLRFIPACAGNADKRPLGALLRSVHPRVCGER